MVQAAAAGAGRLAGTDFAQEAELGGCGQGYVPRSVRKGRCLAPDPQLPRDVLLTGPTGFLGAHLLSDLLAATPARVWCLVRADDAAHARRRIAEAAARYDVIYHAGAAVNFIYPYEELRAANVTGTREVIRLAGLARGIPVHYVSSTAVLAGLGAAGMREVTEESPFLRSLGAELLPRERYLPFLRGLRGADRAAPRAAAGPPASGHGGLGCWFVTGLAADPGRRERLRDVYWIGGGSGAGKSTVARRLADRYGLLRYATDDVMAEHGGLMAREAREAREDSPFLRAFGAMDMDERWVSRSPQVMLETFGWFRGEGFELIVDDLLQLAGSGPGVIAEGFRLLPRLVRPLLADPRHAVWLLPAPDFRRAAFEDRGAPLQFWRRTSDPDRALRNLLERDRMFTARLREEAGRLALPFIEVDATVTEDALVERVAETFGL